jgi:hypothetical protein
VRECVCMWREGGSTGNICMNNADAPCASALVDDREYARC